MKSSPFPGPDESGDFGFRNVQVTRVAQMTSGTATLGVYTGGALGTLGGMCAMVPL